MNRRAEIRIPFPAKAEGFLHNQAFSCELRDLSASGALLLPTVEMKRGQFLRLHLKLPSLEEVIDVDAVVVRATLADGQPEVAIEFHGLTPRAETLLRTYIEWERRRRPTPTPAKLVPAVTAPLRRTPTSSATATARRGTGPGHPVVRPGTGPGHPVVRPGTGPGHPVVRPGTGPGQPVVKPPSSASAPVARSPGASPPARPPTGNAHAAARPPVPPPTGSGQPIVRLPTADSLAHQAELRSLYKMALGELEKG